MLNRLGRREREGEEEIRKGHIYSYVYLDEAGSVCNNIMQVIKKGHRNIAVKRIVCCRQRWSIVQTYI